MLSLAAGVALTGVAIIQALATRRSFPAAAEDLAAYATVLAAGFMASFLLHFAGPRNAAVSWHYLLYDFKVIFLRDTYYAVSVRSLLQGFWTFARLEPLLVGVHVALLLVVLLVRREEESGTSERILCACASAIALANLALGTRPILRDVLWAEMLLNFLSASYVALLLRRGRRPAVHAICGVLLVALVVANSAASARMIGRLNADYNQYGWRDDRWTSAVYGGSQSRYTDLMQQRYSGADLEAALGAARSHRIARRDAQFVFSNLWITERNIGVVARGMPVWTRDVGYRLSEVPEGLRGAVIVDTASLRLRRRQFFQEDLVRTHTTDIDKFKSDGPAGTTAVLTRSDLRVLLFVDASEVARLRSDLIAPSPYAVTLRKGQQSVELTGLEVRNYVELPLEALGGKYFFVIARRA